VYLENANYDAMNKVRGILLAGIPGARDGRRDHMPIDTPIEQRGRRAGPGAQEAIVPPGYGRVLSPGVGRAPVFSDFGRDIVSGKIPTRPRKCGRLDRQADLEAAGRISATWFSSTRTRRAPSRRRR
jgi:hypothetical protein